MNTQKPALWKDLFRDIENAHKISSNWKWERHNG